MEARLLAGARLWLLLLGVGIAGAIAVSHTFFLSAPAAIAVLDDNVDRLQHFVGTFAAMHDPIDWSRPLHVSTIAAPTGTTLFLIDALPLVSFPLRLIYQLFGAGPDPSVVLSVVSFAFYAIGPLSVARLALVVGASRGAALFSGVLIVTIVPLARYQTLSWEGLSAWPLLALLMAELILIERGDRRQRRRAAASALTFALVWSHGYLGAMAGSLMIGLGGWMAIRGRDWRSGLALIAPVVLPYLLAIGLGGVSGGVVSSGRSDGESYLLGGLQVLRIAGIGTADESTLRNADWGALTALLLLVALPAVVRLRAVGAVSIALGVYGLGSLEVGGLIPAAVYFHFPPAALMTWIDRFVIPLVLLSVALAPTQIERWSIPLRTVGRHGGTVTLFLLVTLSAGELTSAVRLFTPGGVYPHTDRSLALQTLIRAHEKIILDPRHHCFSPGGNYPSEHLVLLSMRSAYWISDIGGSTNSFLISRNAPGACEGEVPSAVSVGELLIRYDTQLPDDSFGSPLPPGSRCATMDSTELFPRSVRAPARFELCSLDQDAIQTFDSVD